MFVYTVQEHYKLANVSTTTISTYQAETNSPQIKEENKLKSSITLTATSTEEQVREYFKDKPILVEIAKCESQFRQTDTNGEVLRGQINNQDVGVMQINEKYHLKTSQDKNIDIYTLEGNLAYARELYEKSGSDPWKSSSKCWSKYQEISKK
ncbi:hypothetical protein IT397_03360 [Candidatus Nomurabacteria bacterium]|nr:hypothetical protein [Candidatus Nomurabacteria bacterium]